jgi:hypothetical protein
MLNKGFSTLNFPSFRNHLISHLLVLVGFVVDEVALEQVFFLPVITPINAVHSYIIILSSVIGTVDQLGTRPASLIVVMVDLRL